MNQTTPLADGRRAPAPTASRRILSLADLPVLALGALLATAILGGLTAVTPAGVALAGLSLLITGVVIGFARRQLRADPRAAWFGRMAIALAIATVMMGLAGNVVLLVAAWIVSGRLMAGMIGHVGEWAEARAALRRASIAFGIGDLALVGAALLLSLGTGSTQIAAIVAAAPGLAPDIVLPAAALLVVAALARCALPPFFSWLMRSLAAPTPVSALMHAGFVNAGGFLLIRFVPALEAAPAARFVLFATGILAALAGSAIMLVRSDVKGGLAASTVAQMGFMLLTIALGGYAAALWHMVAHGVFKAWLFLGSAGTVSRAPATKALPRAWPAGIALAALAGGLALLHWGPATALLPLGLAATALLCALAVGLRAASRSPVGMIVIAIPILLIAINAAALAFVAHVQPDAAMPLLSGPAQWVLLLVFLSVWVLQQRVARGEQSLPPALYARLIHAGNPTA
ncbi:proton-conducting transporter transmembrane domain-containing protein [Novosphingobium pokkalii]|uniref:Proton-conducting transporter membrane subunit n=1 Tax=Novosphingobium pokkalii TaxID=1770194 RepID=A0ABV7V2X2_9SPHN|nr:proton-conducting transporter membrane subunit [Novosphingobium pokkalii]GHC86612.1 hypothetical protein GCM10019060_08250 [Novosphingobium pokkalii]